MAVEMRETIQKYLGHDVCVILFNNLRVWGHLDHLFDEAVRLVDVRYSSTSGEGESFGTDPEFAECVLPLHWVASVNAVESVSEFPSFTVEVLDLFIGRGLIKEVRADGLLNEIRELRESIRDETGFCFPVIRVRDYRSLPPRGFSLRLRNAVLAEGELGDGVSSLELLETVETVCRQLA